MRQMMGFKFLLATGSEGGTIQKATTEIRKPFIQHPDIYLSKFFHRFSNDHKAAKEVPSTVLYNNNNIKKKKD